MEEGDSEKMDRKGKRKIEHIIVLDSGESSTKKNSQRNRNIVHEGRRRSSSSVQENQSAPVASPTNVSISTTTATAAATTIWRSSDGRRQRPIQFRNRGPRTFSNSSTTTALDGQETVVAEDGVLPPPQPEKGTTSSSRNQRTFEPNYLCKNCSRPFSNVRVLLRRERNFDINVGIQSRARNATPPTQNNNFSARLTSPELGFNFSHAAGIPPIHQFKSYTHELNEIGFEDIGGRNTSRRRLNTNLSLSNSELINDDVSIDLLSRVGRNNSVENQDHDHDHNNGESDEVVELLSRVGLNPSE